jgi:hypothetical protein
MPPRRRGPALREVRARGRTNLGSPSWYVDGIGLTTASEWDSCRGCRTVLDGNEGHRRCAFQHKPVLRASSEQAHPAVRYARPGDQPQGAVAVRHPAARRRRDGDRPTDGASERTTHDSPLGDAMDFAIHNPLGQVARPVPGRLSQCWIRTAAARSRISPDVREDRAGCRRGRPELGSARGSQHQVLDRDPRRFGSVERQEVRFAGGPDVEPVCVVRGAGITELALRVHSP